MVVQFHPVERVPFNKRAPSSQFPLTATRTPTSEPRASSAR
jgi:hypothetical protein